MMELFVVRHGQSPFTAPTDHQRPLSQLGQKQASQTASYISNQINKASYAIICSDALRTFTTAEIIHSELMTDGLFKAQSHFYHAMVGDWCDAVMSHKQLSHLILVGHNPTLTMLCQYLNPNHLFQFKPACAAHFSLEITADGLNLPAQLNTFFMPDAN